MPPREEGGPGEGRGAVDAGSSRAAIGDGGVAAVDPAAAANEMNPLPLRRRRPSSASNETSRKQTDGGGGDDGGGSAGGRRGHSARSSSSSAAVEPIRMAWHIVPAFLAVWVFRTYFHDRPLRTYRCLPGAVALTPITAVVWLGELLRLSGGRGRRRPRWIERYNRVLRPSEADRPHGTAWYLLGVSLSLYLYPADASLVSIFCLAFCDPAASVVGRKFGDRPWTGGRYGANGKSFAGTFACGAVAATIVWIAHTGLYVVVPDAPPSSSGMRWREIVRSVATTSAKALLDDERRASLATLSVVAGITVGAAEAAGSPAFLKFALNDNLAIPIVTGAVVYVARGALLGWD